MENLQIIDKYALSSDNKLNLTRLGFESLYYLKSYDNMLNLTGWVSGPYNTSRVKVSGNLPYTH
jgi:hypothetical protein